MGVRIMNQEELNEEIHRTRQRIRDWNTLWDQLVEEDPPDPEFSSRAGYYDLQLTTELNRLVDLQNQLK